ncbi:polysaccharide deacetylase family protein [Halobacillus salinus]|nr:polysaccharide deacetylase family protein [Halobacillus salinus]
MRKRCCIAFICVLIFTICPIPLQADEADPEVLLLYSIDKEQQMKEVHRLDLLTGHFTNDISLYSVEDFLQSSEEIDTFDRVLYLRRAKGEPEQETIELLNRYEGPTYFIGKAMEAFKAGESLECIEEIIFDTIDDGEDSITLQSEKVVDYYEIPPSTNVMYSTHNGAVPLIFQQDTDFFAPISEIDEQLGAYIGETLFSFFNQKKGEAKISLRLEDIHPMYDPTKLKEVGDYLRKKEIPYMITVIPVYTNPKTGEELHLEDAPRLVRVLRKMQEQGASIVLHGYKHQYRKTVTGEGFEYWDVQNDRPLYQKPNEARLGPDDFATQEEYDDYVAQGHAFERNYIENTISNGVNELVEQGLYPLAFEAPHYAMSLSGYEVLSDYFSTYVGQVQTSNNTHISAFSPSYRSEAAMLDGMTLIPETLGYVREGDKKASKKISKNYQYFSRFSDSISGMFFHPYLGVDRLEKVVNELEKDHFLTWFNLKDEYNKVEINEFVIESNAGEIVTNKEEDEVLTSKVWWGIVPLLVGGIIFFTQSSKKPQDLDQAQ